ncbi:MAG TPA: 2,3,4,5-tetrahydropyridine-2,6-dicarboxylate N-succinyltransferase [Vicinamibacterales bacterium]|nr:2,3,4,5-tetrahydropyridine-2,6-dicarboxylate N-succinyltransferase [Vicinamibacterales bacterium]
MSDLQQRVETLFAQGAEVDRKAARACVKELRDALSAGTVRSAEPHAASPSGWRVNTWVKRGILLAFRTGAIVEEEGMGYFADKDTLPLKRFPKENNIRVVPGGSSVRDGVYVGRNVIFMPPMYVNIGAWIGDDSLIDSHALVGSCAQIGSRVHLSAAAQIGGVIEPVGALPVIVEDDVLVGGNCGVYEGAVIKRRAVLASGTVITRSTPVYDTVHGRIITAAADEPLVIPEGAVVVPGTRPLTSGHGAEWGLAVAAPIIVKYRDERTDARTALEQWIR